MRKNRHEIALEKMDAISEDVRTKLVATLESKKAIADKISETEYLLALIERDTAKPPVKDKLSDRSCPTCGAYINWDALNDPISYVPEFCKCCGQRFDWRTEKKYKEEF